MGPFFRNRKYKIFIMIFISLDSSLFSPIIVEASWSHSDTQQLLGFLWTSDEPEAKNSTWQHITHRIGRYPCSPRDSNLQSQKVNGGRRTSKTARPLWLAPYKCKNNWQQSLYSYIFSEFLTISFVFSIQINTKTHAVSFTVGKLCVSLRINAAGT